MKDISKRSDYSMAAKATLPQRHADLIDYIQVKTGGRLGQQYNSDYTALVAVKLIGGTDDLCELRRVKAGVQAAGKPRGADDVRQYMAEMREQCKRLDRMCKHQSASAKDRANTIAAIVEVLSDYPREIAFAAMQHPWEWMPCANELLNECERLLGPRRMLTHAIDRRIFDIESKQRRALMDALHAKPSSGGGLSSDDLAHTKRRHEDHAAKPIDGGPALLGDAAQKMANPYDK